MFTAKFFRSILPIAFAFAANSLFAASSVPQPLFSDASEHFALITVPMGTTVKVVLNQQVAATDVAIGNALDFMVRGDVVVAGRVVIADGATATGIVTKVEPGCNGQCSNLTITVESAQAVDGSTINLNSIPHVIKAPCCDGTATGNIGTPLTAKTRNIQKVNA